MMTNGSGNHHDHPASEGVEAIIGHARGEAAAVLYTQLAHAVGLAMQNVVAQQQTLQTINNAIATKALNLLAESDPKSALDVIQQRETTENAEISAMFTTLSNIINNTKPQGSP